MFAGRRRRRSSAIRAMQLFHELKQRFPRVPDRVVSDCIASRLSPNDPHHDDDDDDRAREAVIRDILDAAPPPDAPMGRPHVEPAPAPTPPERPSPSGRPRTMPNDRDAAYTKKTDSVALNRRPDRLDLRPDFDDFEDSGRLKLSEKCRDVHKLLNSDRVSDKPPRSPSNGKRLLPVKPEVKPNINETVKSPKKETASTPTQTTDTLLGLGGTSPTSVNLSLNVNCSMDLLQSPKSGRRTSVLQVTPQQPWLPELTQESPRSYTSVNLTLRPPSAAPQAPIDITSRNSSLTYSTSSFDSQKGLQSRLQITVGPGGGGVSSVRARPRSSYHPGGDDDDSGAVVPARTNSLDDLATQNCEPPVILKQEARIERLRIELKTEKANLIVMQREVSDLEKIRVRTIEHKVDAEFEKQLRKEIKHLQYQCSQLATEVDKVLVDNAHEAFYNNIYTGQRGQLLTTVDNNATRISINRDGGGRIPPPYHHRAPGDVGGVAEGLKWDCPMCTFLNHPDLDKCEQCDMPRIYHGNKIDRHHQQPSPIPNVSYNSYLAQPYFNSHIPNYPFYLHNYQGNPTVCGNGPIGFVLPNGQHNPDFANFRRIIGPPPNNLDNSVQPSGRHPRI